jgi:hypothetical protein
MLTDCFGIIQLPGVFRSSGVNQPHAAFSIIELVADIRYVVVKPIPD